MRMIILGVDGGGTKTHALAVDENGKIIGRGISGPSNYHVVGLEKALDSLTSATLQALNGQHADIAIFCLGACDSDVDEQRLTDGLNRRLVAQGYAKQVICSNDSFAPLRAGSTRPYGAVVICGTGFNAGGIAPDGRRKRLFSLGTLTGDWGGGYSLGEAVFAAVFRADECRAEPTILKEMLLQALDIPNLNRLAEAIVDGKITHTLVGKLAPLAFQAADKGDVPAQQIILKQADEVAIAAHAILRSLQMLDVDVDVILSGGVFRGHGTLLIEESIQRIVARCPRASVRRLEIPPVIGSVYLGFDALNLPTPVVETRALFSAEPEA